MDGLQFLQQGDAVTRGVALLLLAMSVASWVVILWKAWLLRRATGDVARSTAAFWQAASVADAEQSLAAARAGGSADLIRQNELNLQSLQTAAAASKKETDP